MEGIVFLNGLYLPASEARVPIFDRGFTYGDGLFETMRIYRGKAFALDLHIQRMRIGAEELAIPFPDGIKAIIPELIKRNDLSRCGGSIRITLTRGMDSGHAKRDSGLLPPVNPSPTVVIVARPLDPKVKERQREGVKATFLEGLKPSLPWIKSLNRLPHILGAVEANRRGVDEGLFVTKDGEILEGTVSNIFIVDNDLLKTPPLGGILPGITRRFILELARRLGLSCQETSIMKGDMEGCQEAFLTNSLLEVAPLIMVDGMPIGDGRIGPMTRDIQRAYRELVKATINP